MILETGPRVAARAAAVGLELGFRPVFARAPGELVAPAGEAASPRVALVGLPGGEASIAKAAELPGGRGVIVAAVSGDPASAWPRAQAAGADLLALRPHTSERLGPVLLAAQRLARERARARELEGEGERLRERIETWGEVDRATGFHPFEFFKRILFMEIKRAKRYGYSLAACLVALDPGPAGEGSAASHPGSERRNRVAAAISSCIRDIDLPVDYADDRFLVFLPYTELAGAERVGARIAATVAYKAQDDGTSVSIGIAALRPGQAVSFARLMRDAGAALKAAQHKGGGQVVVRR